MTQLFEMSVTNRDDAIYTRRGLLMSPDGTVPHPQPDSILVDKGELRLADGWMRATAPSGRAAYEGVIAWTPTAGVGTRPAEKGQSREPDSRQPTANSKTLERATGDGGRATGATMVELVLFVIFAAAALFGAVTMVWARTRCIRRWG